MRDFNWVSLTDAQRGQLVAIWMLAADHEGSIPSDARIIKKLCFMETEPDMKTLINLGFLEGRRQPDATVTTPGRQLDAPETEERRDRGETEKSIAAAAATPQAEFVLRFKQTYEAKTGSPYRAGKKDYVIASGLIDSYGMDACVKKAVIFAALCERKSAWFTEDGWASYTVGKLAAMWNNILPEARKATPEEELKAEMKRQEAMRERADRLVK